MIISVIKSGTLFDCYYRLDNNLIWFMCLPGDCNPAERKNAIHEILKLCEPDYTGSADSLAVYIYERKI